VTKERSEVKRTSSNIQSCWFEMCDEGEPMMKDWCFRIQT